jgi:hypothetical protein
LPDGEVPVLNGKLGQLRRRARRVCLIALAQLAQEYASGPPIEDGVVEDELEHVLVGGEPEEPGAK